MIGAVDDDPGYSAGPHFAEGDFNGAFHPGSLADCRVGVILAHHSGTAAGMAAAVKYGIAGAPPGP